MGISGSVMSWRGVCLCEEASMEDLCSFLCTWWVLQKGDVYLSHRGQALLGTWLHY